MYLAMAVAHSLPTCVVLPSSSLKRPGWESCFFFEFMFLIGSNYKGPQGGPGGRERTWAGQRFTASAHHPHLPPAPPQVHVEKCLRPFK